MCCIDPRPEASAFRRWSWAAVGVVAGCAGAGEPPFERPILPAAIVSDPSGAPVAGARAGHGSLHVAALDEVVYVSLPPGTVQYGQQVTVTNLQGGATAATAFVDGGFDPIPITASAGDTLELAVRLVNSTTLRYYATVVPTSRPPIVVRTEPPPRKRDVPLNAVMVIVFSEPIDPATLTSASVQLLAGGQPMAGQLALTTGSPLTVTFTPAEPLAMETDYVLVIAQSVEDLDGDALEEAVLIEFTTVGPTLLVFESDRSGNMDIYTLDPDNGTITQVTSDTAHDGRPKLSPDGTRIVFERGRGLFDERAIYIVNSDGSGETLLRDSAACPLWVPDGTRILFRASGGSAYVMNPDGSNVVPVAAGSSCDGTFSPDGQRVVVQIGSALVVQNLDGSGGWQVAIPPAGWYYSPAWSPDGRWIALAGVTYYETDVYVIRPSGSGLVRLTDSPGRDMSPVWSPDGARIAFVSDRGGGGIYVMNADGSGVTRLTHHAGDGRPSWSRR